MNLSDLVLALAERHLINRDMGKLIELGETLERLTQTVVRLSGGAIVSPAAHRTPVGSQCRDMLGRDVREGDVMFSIVRGVPMLRPARLRLGDYKCSVRCPRPGEPIPEFTDWMNLCLSMQGSGATFQRYYKASDAWRDYRIFEDTDSTQFRRSPNCTLTVHSIHAASEYNEAE